MVRYLKQIIVAALFIGELTLFGYVCLYGVHGVNTLNGLKKENAHVLKNIHMVQDKIQKVANTISMWHSNPFYTEQIARQELHMAHTDEIIYYIA